MKPLLRLATRRTPRTRLTAWAIAFACMVLVGSLSLVEGLGSGVDSVAGRLDLGPAVYIEGSDVLESRIPAEVLAELPADRDVLRVHVGRLEVNGLSLDVPVASVERVRDGNATTDWPPGSREVSLDRGLRTRIEAESGRPPEAFANLTLFDGPTLVDVAVAAAPPASLEILPDDWAYVRTELLASLDFAVGSSAQAVVLEEPLEDSLATSLGLAPLDVVGAVGFFRGSVREAGDALRSLAVLAAAVIGLLVYAAMSLEVHERSSEIRTLRSLGASPRRVASVYEAQALLLGLLGATLGSTLGIVAAHAVVSFSPLAGLPNLVILGLPTEAVLLAYAVAVVASAVAGIVPSRRASLVSGRAREVGPS